MAHSVGIDIIEVERVAGKLTEGGFIDRVFTPAEIDYCQARSVPARHFAARFAAKEAVAKALGQEWPRWLEIEVVKTDAGKPEISLSGETAALANEAGVALTVSLTHLDATAAAAVVAYPAENK